MSDGLIVFLRDRIDEDEVTATEAIQETTGRWTARETNWGGGMVVEDDCGAMILGTSRGDVQYPHIARQDPARTLAEVASKRAILAWHSTPHTVLAEATTYAEVGFCSECDGQCTHKGEAVCECCGFNDGCPTVRHLATAYADHADYQEEWKW